jgi:hypothetical protein
MNNAGMGMSTANGMTTNGMTTNGMTNMPSFNTNMFNSATSPAASTTDVAHTPQTTTSSTPNTMAVAATTTSGMHGTTTTATSYRVETEEADDPNPFCDFRRPFATNNGFITAGGGSREYVLNDPKDAELAAQVDFGGFEDQEEEEDENGCV